VKLNLEEIIEATNAKKKNEGERFTIYFLFRYKNDKSGEIYLPLKGENFDGETFIDKAIEAGAIGYFTTKINLNNDAKLILQIENTLTTYLELARFCVPQNRAKNRCNHGSSGKTTTQEMAYSVAREKFRTHKSELNFNNEIGLCKTILSMLRTPKS
jgi:UDP-N-acetylmuramoyl-tripeptide--D-alanyl-D-alanine ligase